MDFNADFWIAVATAAPVLFLAHVVLLERLMVSLARAADPPQFRLLTGAAFTATFGAGGAFLGMSVALTELEGRGGTTSPEVGWWCVFSSAAALFAATFTNVFFEFRKRRWEQRRRMAEQREAGPPPQVKAPTGQTGVIDSPPSD